MLTNAHSEVVSYHISCYIFKFLPATTLNFGPSNCSSWGCFKLVVGFFFCSCFILEGDESVLTCPFTISPFYFMIDAPAYFILSYFLYCIFHREPLQGSIGDTSLPLQHAYLRMLSCCIRREREGEGRYRKPFQKLWKHIRVDAQVDIEFMQVNVYM